MVKFSLPPDVEFIAYADAPDAWHIDRSIWGPIRQQLNLSSINYFNLDTGYTKHVNGPDPKWSRSYISGQSVADGNGHGTHTIGSTIDPVIGIAPGCNLGVYKVLSNQGSGGSAGIAQAIRDAADAGAHVISMSLGGGSEYRPTSDAIDYAFSKGCWVNAAAGNSGFNGANSIGWPAKHHGCLCCAAYRKDGQIANFSSGGREIDWACPGQEIVSWRNNRTGWTVMSGTSMATPIGSGFLCILYHLMLREGWPILQTAADMRDYFKNNMKDSGAPGFDFRFGHGIPVVGDLVKSITDDDLIHLSLPTP